MHKRLWLTGVLLAGCAGPTTDPVAASPAPEPATSGGEATAVEEPPPMRATVPIPVPQPGQPREELSPALQLVWERVELAVAVRPPEPPEGASEAEVEAWANGPFAAWLEARGEATSLALEAMRGMAEAPIEERALGTALFGYLYEDAVSGVRGAPLPAALGADPELLAAYTESLNEHLLPYARLSAQAYAGCIALFQQVTDPAWGEWPYYCDERGGEVVETFGLAGDAPVTEAPAGEAAAEPTSPDAGL